MKKRNITEEVREAEQRAAEENRTAGERYGGSIQDDQVRLTNSYMRGYCGEPLKSTLDEALRALAARKIGDAREQIEATKVWLSHYEIYSNLGDRPRQWPSDDQQDDQQDPFLLKPEYGANKDTIGLVRACRWAYYHGDTHSGFQMCQALDQLVFSSDPFAATPDDQMDNEKASWARSARACRGAKQELEGFFEDESAAKQALVQISLLLTSKNEEMPTAQQRSHIPATGPAGANRRQVGRAMPSPKPPRSV